MPSFYVHSRFDVMQGVYANTEAHYACYVEAESPGEALAKAAEFCSGPTNGWEVSAQAEGESFPSERFFNRNLTVKEVAEAKAEAYGQTWDPEAYEEEKRLRAQALEELSAIFEQGVGVGGGETN